MQLNKYVYVVDDDEHSHNGVSDFLRSEGFEILLFPCADDFLKALPDLEAGCVIMDMGPSERIALEVLQSLRKSWRETPVIMISGNRDVATAVEAMRSGASDFIEKPVQPEVLLEKIKRVCKTSFPRKQRKRLRPSANPVLECLTNRELEVLSLLLEGYRNKQVAHKLGISPRTVEVHRAKIMHRLNATSFAELIKLITLADPSIGPQDVSLLRSL